MLAYMQKEKTPLASGDIITSLSLQTAVIYQVSVNRIITLHRSICNCVSM